MQRKQGNQSNTLKPDEGLEEFFGLHHAELDAIMMDVLRQVASIKDAECQERVEKIIAEADRLLLPFVYDGSPKRLEWQALKEKEGVKLQKLDPPPRFDEVYRQGVRNMEEPDEGRLLTDEELGKKIDEQVYSAYFVGKNCIGFPPGVKTRVRNEILKLVNSQCDLTASTKDAECYKRITAVEKTLEKLHLDDQDQWMDTLFAKDAECQERVERIFKETEEDSHITKLEDGKFWQLLVSGSFWQALKKKEGVK